MPDFERLLRKLELDMAPEEERPLIAARHQGEDHARKQVAIVAAVVALFALIIVWAIC
jgi:hypothetical protein